MKVGYLYKKGKSIYLCVTSNKGAKIRLADNINGMFGDIPVENCGNESCLYTELGKASEIIKRGLEQPK